MPEGGMGKPGYDQGHVSSVEVGPFDSLQSLSSIGYVKSCQWFAARLESMPAGALGGMVGWGRVREGSAQ